LAYDEALEAKKEKDRRGFSACLAIVTKSQDTEAKITIPENKNVSLTITNQSDIDARLAELAERRKSRTV
jgi:hypothetical protein